MDELQKHINLLQLDSRFAIGDQSSNGGLEVSCYYTSDLKLLSRSEIAETIFWGTKSEYIVTYKKSLSRFLLWMVENEIKHPAFEVLNEYTKAILV